MVEPEGHPGHHDDEEGGDVDGDDVVRDLPLEGHGQLKATVASWNEKMGQYFEMYMAQTSQMFTSSFYSRA